MHSSSEANSPLEAPLSPHMQQQKFGVREVSSLPSRAAEDAAAGLCSLQFLNSKAAASGEITCEPASSPGPPDVSEAWIAMKSQGQETPLRAVTFARPALPSFEAADELDVNGNSRDFERRDGAPRNPELKSVGHDLETSEALQREETSLPDALSSSSGTSALHTVGAFASSSPEHSGSSSKNVTAAGSSNQQWAKYGEAHSEEGATPASFLWPSPDGCWCGYATEFLFYNKTAERLLPFEALENEEPGAVAMFAKLLHVSLAHSAEELELAAHPSLAEAYPHRSSGRRRQTNALRGRRGSRASFCISASTNSSTLSRTVMGTDSSATPGGGDPSAGLALEGTSFDFNDGPPQPSQGESVVLPRVPRHLRSFSVRVELRDWRITYGSSPQQVPSLWVVSAMGRHYRLEKPAGRYASLFAAAKRKFEVAARVLPKLLASPDTPYEELRDLLTAAERQRVSGLQREVQGTGTDLHLSSADLGAAPSGMEVEGQPLQTTFDDGDSGTTASGRTQEGATLKISGRASAQRFASACSSLPSPLLLFAHSKLISGVSTRKGKGVHQCALSDPDGTGVRILPDGSASPLCDWGGAFAVQGLTESLLLQLTPFLLKEAAAVEATLNAGIVAEEQKLPQDETDGVEGGAPVSDSTHPVRLLSLPFFSELRRRAEAAGLSTSSLNFSQGGVVPPASNNAELAGSPGEAAVKVAVEGGLEGGGVFLPTETVSLQRAQPTSQFPAGTGRGGGRRGKRQKTEIAVERTSASAPKALGFAESACLSASSLQETKDGPALQEGAGPSVANSILEDHSRQSVGAGIDDFPQRREEEEGREETRAATSGKPLDDLSLDCHAPILQSHPLPLSRLVLYRHPELLQLQDFLRVFAEYSHIPPPSLQSLEAAVLVGSSPPGGEDRRPLGSTGPVTRGFTVCLEELPQVMNSQSATSSEGEAPGSSSEEAKQASEVRDSSPCISSELRRAVETAEAAESGDEGKRFAEKIPLFLGEALLLRYLQMALAQIGDAIPRALAVSGSVSSFSSEEVLLPHEKAVPASLWLGLDLGPCDALSVEAALLGSSPEEEGGASEDINDESSGDGVCACFERDAFGDSTLTPRLRRLMSREEQISLLEKAREASAAAAAPAALATWSFPATSPLQSLSDLPLDVRLVDPLTAPVLLKRVLFECLYTPRRRRFKLPASSAASGGGGRRRSVSLDVKSCITSTNYSSSAEAPLQSRGTPPADCEAAEEFAFKGSLSEEPTSLMAPLPSEAALVEAEGDCPSAVDGTGTISTAGEFEKDEDLKTEAASEAVATVEALSERKQSADAAWGQEVGSRGDIDGGFCGSETETARGVGGESFREWNRTDECVPQLSAIEWHVDEAKAELCGVSTWELDGYLVALHALRQRSFWSLPRRIRCLLLHQLQTLVATGWQARFFMDCKVEALGRARLGLLRLKASAQNADDLTTAGSNAGIRTPPKSHEGFKGDTAEVCVSFPRALQAASASAGTSEAEGPSVKKDEDGSARSCDANGAPAKGQRRRPVGRVTNVEAERLTLCFSVRAELLGQDRFLNRYFSVGARDGRCTSVYVEAVCQPSPAQLLSHRARAEAKASLARRRGMLRRKAAEMNISPGKRKWPDRQETDTEQLEEEAREKRPRPSSQELEFSDSASGLQSRSTLRVYPPCKAETDAFASLSSWPIVRRPFDIQSLHAFLEMLQIQRTGSCCFKVESGVLPLLASSLHPGLQRERLLKTQLLAAHAKIQAGSPPAPSLLPPSPLASGVWTACKSLFATDALLLQKCLPVLWELPQQRELSEVAAEMNLKIKGSSVFSAGSAFRAALRLLSVACMCAPCQTQVGDSLEDECRVWKAQALFTAALTHLLLQVEALAEGTGSVHSAAWTLRRQQWRKDVVRMAGGEEFLDALPLSLPLPGQPEEAVLQDLRGESEDSALEDSDDCLQPRGRGRLRRHQAIFDGDSSDAEEETQPDAAAAKDSRPSSSTLQEAEPDSQNAPLPNSNSTSCSREAISPSAAPVCPQPSAFELRPSFSPAMAEAAERKAALAAAKAAKAATPGQAEVDRFDGLLDCLCAAFGWNREAVESLLEAHFQATHASSSALDDTETDAEKEKKLKLAECGPAAVASANATEEDGVLHVSCDEMHHPDLWAALRRCEDLLSIWGVLFSLWKLSGVDAQRLIDLHTTIDRDEFEEMLEGEVQRKLIPRVGDELIYFRRGHEQLVISGLQSESARGGVGCSKTGCALSLPASLGWAEELSVQSVRFHAGVTAASANSTAPDPLLPYALRRDAEAGYKIVGSRTLPVQNALQAMPCGGLEFSAAGLLPSLFSFVLEDDPIALGLAKPPSTPPPAQPPASPEVQSSSSASSSTEGLTKQGAAEGSSSEADGSDGLPTTPASDKPAEPAAAAATESAKSADAVSSLPWINFEGVVPKVVEDFLLQADPLRLAARSAESAKAYVRKQLDSQRAFLHEQRSGNNTEAPSGSGSFDTTFSPYFRVVCSVRPRRHPTTCDSVASHLRRMAASAAAGRLSTRTSSRLSRSAFSASSANESGVAGGAEASRRVSTAEDSGQSSPPAPEDEDGSASGGEGLAESACLSGLSWGPQLKRRWVVLCVPLRHLNNCSSSFLVPSEAVLRALKASWCCGMRFRMTLESCPSAAAAAAGVVPRTARGLGLAICNEALREQRALQQEQRLTGIIRGIALQPSTLWEGVSVEWEERRTNRPDSNTSASVAAAATSGKLSLWQLEPLKRLKRPGAQDL